MKTTTCLCFAALAIAVLFHSGGASAADLHLDGALGSGVYATEYGGITTGSTCAVNSGANVTLVADRFTFGPGFRVQSGGRLAVKFADYNSLGDAWEIQNFGSLSQNPTADPDGDGLTNYAEYQLGTNPIVADLDTDVDGLLDTWEILSFGNLLSGPTGDPDSDGSTNYVELKLRTKPASASSHADPGVYYFYDALGRLTAVYKYSGGVLQYGIEYEYDSLGNRTRMSVTTAN